MKVSIIVPIFNMEDKIECCLESLINQTYHNIEIILVCDGCTDNSFNICKNYCNLDSRIKLYEKKNGGVSSARNLGLSNASGDYIMFVDPDDWIELNTVEIALNKCEKEKCEILQFNFNSTYDLNIEKKTTNEIYNGFLSNEKCILAIISELYGKKELNINFGAIRSVWGKLYKSSVIEDLNFFEDIYIFEDGIFNLYAFSNVNKIYFCNIALYNYRIQNESANNRYKKDCMIQVEKYLKYIHDFIEKKQIENNDSYLLLIYESFIRILNQYICCKENDLNDSEKIIVLKKVIESEMYYKNLNKLKYKYFNFKNKVLLFFIKNKIYTLLYFANKIKKYGVN